MSALYTQSSLPDSNLASGEEQGPSRCEWVLLSKIKTLKITGIKGPIRKILKPAAVLSQGLS
jgi:hypothetical protein